MKKNLTIALFLASAFIAACRISVPATSTAIHTVESPTLVLSAAANRSLAADQSFSNPLSLTDDASYYRSSHGGPLKNGCEGWLSQLKTGEHIFASRCDQPRLEALGLYAGEAIGFNAKETASRRITNSETYIMMDYEDEKTQGLYGVTSNKSDAYLILNAKKEYIFYRAVGSRAALKDLGFLVNALLAANESAETRFQIVILDDQLNVAEDKSNHSQFLVGKTSDGKTIALVVDQNGTFIGKRTQP